MPKWPECKCGAETKVTLPSGRIRCAVCGNPIPAPLPKRIERA